MDNFLYILAFQSRSFLALSEIGYNQGLWCVELYA